MNLTQNLLKLCAVAALGVFLLNMVLKYAFGIDVLYSPQYHLVRLGLLVVFLYMLYNEIFEPGRLQELGTAAVGERRLR